MKYFSLFLLSVFIALPGCSEKTKENSRAAEAELQSGEAGFQGCSETGRVDLDVLAEREGRLYTLYYDYDKLHVRDECKEFLLRNSEWMSSHPDMKITIAGHTDERGTTEYNLAAGEKRASLIKRYLKDHGISQDRVRTISHGDERPVDEGHNEVAWARNRRIEFVISR